MVLLLQPPQLSQPRKHRRASWRKVKKQSFPPHLWPGFMPPDLMHLNEARKVGAQLSSLKAERAMIHPPNVWGGLFLFINCRWNLANHTPTLSVLGRWGIQLWVESTSFLPSKRAVLSSSKYFWRRRAGKTLRNSCINEGYIIAYSQ